MLNSSHFVFVFSQTHQGVLGKRPCWSPRADTLSLSCVNICKRAKDPFGRCVLRGHQLSSAVLKGSFCNIFIFFFNLWNATAGLWQRGGVKEKLSVHFRGGGTCKHKFYNKYNKGPKTAFATVPFVQREVFERGRKCPPVVLCTCLCNTVHYWRFVPEH